MELGEGTLEEWFKNQWPANSRQFPGAGKSDYAARYSLVAAHLNSEVHPHVGAGALLNGDGYLTDHGPDHIATVIRRASDLAKAERFDLKPYECYILLMAIHMHDVGNIFGRKGHESASEKVMADLGKLMGEDVPEKRLIRNVAAAHGGSAGGDKDTIRTLNQIDEVLGQQVRTRLLAAMLRFADELADDSRRSARYLLEAGKIPQGSEVHHMYARSLHSVIVDPNGGEVRLGFEFSVDDAKRKFGKKGASDVYLLDEIFERTLKMHMERCYCSRFMTPGIEMNSIRVRISVGSNGFNNVVKEIDYQLQERGYPGSPSGGIYGLCPELKAWQGSGRLDGQGLAGAVAAN